MKILVTGKNGQLGQSFQKLVYDNYKNNLINFDFVFASRQELDFRDIDSLKHYFNKNIFDVIINCAAYTKVDKAEVNEEKANLVNNIAVKEIAQIAKTANIRFIHISTDFVFDGNKDKPYNDSDFKLPLNIYGKTKLAGEEAILSSMHMNALIIRSGWIYSEYKNNFVDTILNLGKTNKHLHIVSDQLGTPTYANDLAEVIIKIMKDHNFNKKNFVSKIYNFSNLGGCSWYDFAKEILFISKLTCKITPIKSHEYPLPAKRPKYSILNKKKIIKDYGLDIRHWKDSLKICLKNLENFSN